MSRLIELDAYLDEVIELNLFPQGISTRKLQGFTPKGKKPKISSKLIKKKKDRLDKRLAKRAQARPSKGYIKPEDTPLGKMNPDLARKNRARIDQIDNRQKIEKLKKQRKAKKNPLYDTRNPDFHGYR